MRHATIVGIRVTLTRLAEGCRALGLCMGAAGAILLAQTMTAQKPEDQSRRPAFRTESVLVLVPTTVVDRRGAFVNGLRRDAFTVDDDGVKQDIRAFSEDDAPVSLGVVLDLSGSMKGVLSVAKESLRALAEDANPNDEAFLNVVSTRPRPFSGFTDEPGDLVRRIFAEDAGGSTALIDTIANSLVYLRQGRHQRKALVVISDGIDNHSRYSRRELLRQAVESDAQIYAIALCAVPAYAKPVELTPFKAGQSFLTDLASRTGGVAHLVSSPQDLTRAAASIVRALHNQYNIGFAPRDTSGSGKWHRIKITVAGSGMRAYARTGYRLK